MTWFFSFSFLNERPYYTIYACVCAFKCVCVCVCMCVHSVMSSSLQSSRPQPASLRCWWNYPGKNTGLGCHFLLQEIFPTQGLNPSLLHLLHWQVESLPLAPPGKNTTYYNTRKFDIFEAEVIWSRGHLLKLLSTGS